MGHVHVLPDDLVQRYNHWKTNTLADQKDQFQDLADHGQTPRAIVISCCDSRVNAPSIFEAGHGDFFVHRNIANFVPAYTLDKGRTNCTPAALEYAVTVLKVSEIIVLGHSQCGGVRGCHDMCAGHAPALEAPESFVGRWIDHIRPAYEKVKDIPDDATRIDRMEREAVITSLENLMTYPFIQSAVATGQLNMHGLWIDISNGALEQFDSETGWFRSV
ncbi:MAG: carbonic anhydrase [Pseudomonadota bacterium]